MPAADLSAPIPALVVGDGSAEVVAKLVKSLAASGQGVRFFEYS